MKLAYQVPIPNLDDFIGEQDFFFALAPLVLESEEYSNWFIDRPTLLDNGVHELGQSITLDLLLEAKNLLGNKCAVIPPDVLFSAPKTLHNFYEMLQAHGSVSDLWPVLQGRTWRELMKLVEKYAQCDVTHICIPYRLGSMTRVLLARELAHYDGIGIHFLGLNNADELRALRFTFDSSLDTGKPLRWAQNGYVWPDVHDNKPLKLRMKQDVNVHFAKMGIQRIKEIVDFVSPS